MIIPMDDTNHLIPVERAAPRVQSLQPVPTEDGAPVNQSSIHAHVLRMATPPEAPRPMPEQQIRYWRVSLFTRACGKLLWWPFRRP
jgi:hypothetical protein